MKFYSTQTFGFSFLTLLIIGLLGVLYVDQSIQIQLKEKRFLKPTRYYGLGKKFYQGRHYSPKYFNREFKKHHYQKKRWGVFLEPGTYSLGTGKECEPFFPLPLPHPGDSQKPKEKIHHCLHYRLLWEPQSHLLGFDQDNQLIEILGQKNPSEHPINPLWVGKQGGILGTKLKWAESEPELFAQYMGHQPVFQDPTSLGEVPRYCLDALMAIEDPSFLKHHGVSPRGILRAFWVNLQQARWSQGGSTITQQLVKNFFLTPEKTLWRKVKEIFISLVLEFRMTKDDILETYINIIYLGQTGVFEIRGYKAAAQYYFGKPLGRLNLADCSLLAAMVNSPGNYNPRRHPKKAQNRRQKVLEKMQSHNLISTEELQEAQGSPLPKSMKTPPSSSTPYYVHGVQKRLREWGFKDLSGLSIYTTMVPEFQKRAEQAIQHNIRKLEKSRPSIKNLKKQGHRLQAFLLSCDSSSGNITALVGGRDFASSPYNRALNSRRQVGSIFKPIVYLAALKKNKENISPLTLLDNSPLEYKYDSQVWSPKNYHKTFSPPVPLFYALKESINIPTVRLALDTGLKEVMETARSLDIQSPMKPYPSLSLGTFELSPLEVLRAYSTISQMGEKHSLKFIRKVQNPGRKVVFQALDNSSNSPTQPTPSTQDRRSREPPPNPIHMGSKRQKAFALLVGMLKEVFVSGTASSAKALGFQKVAGGKTGTTSDTKDAWFVGFTPHQVTVTWVGYDESLSHGLTGASGALPIWVDYMSKVSSEYPNTDFPFPPGVEKRVLSKPQLLELGVPDSKAKDTELIFLPENPGE